MDSLVQEEDEMSYFFILLIPLSRQSLAPTEKLHQMTSLGAQRLYAALFTYAVVLPNTCQLMLKC